MSNQSNDIPNGFKETEIGIIPEDWEVVKLGDVVEVHDKRRIPLSAEERSKIKGKYPYCGANGIIDYISDFIFEGEYVLLAEDGGFWGKYQNTAYIMNGQFWVNNHAHIIKAIDGLTINKFLLYWFIFDDIEKYTSGTTRKKLNQNVMKKILIPLPPLPEQKKIAYVLSTIQEAKERTKAVIKAAKKLKKSLMKYLFTYGSVPFNEAENVKIKETEIGLIPEDWEVVKLGDVARIKYGKSKPKEDGMIPVVGSGGIYSHTSKPLVDFPTIVIGRKGTAGRVWLLTEPCYPSDTTFYLDWKKNVNIYYLFYFMMLNPLSGEHAKTTLPSLQKPDLENFLIPLPPLSIQQKIASILSAVDEKIEKEENKKKALEELFKSMLHNLMTGKIRVKDLDIVVDEEKEEGKELEMVDKNGGK